MGSEQNTPELQHYNYNCKLLGAIQDLFLNCVVTKDFLHLMLKYQPRLNVQIITMHEIDRFHKMLENSTDRDVNGELLRKISKHPQWFSFVIAVLKDPEIRLKWCVDEMMKIKLNLDRELEGMPISEMSGAPTYQTLEQGPVVTLDVGNPNEFSDFQLDDELSTQGGQSDDTQLEVTHSEMACQDTRHIGGPQQATLRDHGGDFADDQTDESFCTAIDGSNKFSLEANTGRSLQSQTEAILTRSLSLRECSDSETFDLTQLSEEDQTVGNCRENSRPEYIDGIEVRYSVYVLRCQTLFDRRDSSEDLTDETSVNGKRDKEDPITALDATTLLLGEFPDQEASENDREKKEMKSFPSDSSQLDTCTVMDRFFTPQCALEGFLQSSVVTDTIRNDNVILPEVHSTYISKDFYKSLKDASILDSIQNFDAESVSITQEFYESPRDATSWESGHLPEVQSKYIPRGFLDSLRKDATSVKSNHSVLQ